jgi:flagellar motor switch protein FliM
MKTASFDSLSNEKIQQLLAAVGSAGQNQSDKIDAPEYDWRQPRYFNASQVSKLEELASKTAEAIALKFSDLYHAEFKVTASPASQHYGEQFLDAATIEKLNEYYFPFGISADTQCGVVAIPFKTAAGWAMQLLGDTDSEKNIDKPLSELEESLLLDIAWAILNAFTDSHGSNKFAIDQSFNLGKMPLTPQPTDILCKFAFHVEKAGSSSPSDAYILIACNMLEAAVGSVEKAAAKISSEDLYKTLLSNIQDVPVSINIRFASTMLTFKEAMDIEVNDVVMLDKFVNEPVELIVEGRTALKGKPSQTDGAYAVFITEVVSNNKNAVKTANR